MAAGACYVFSGCHRHARHARHAQDSRPSRCPSNYDVSYGGVCYYEDLEWSLTVRRKKMFAVLATLSQSYHALKKVGCMHKTSCKEASWVSRRGRGRGCCCLMRLLHWGRGGPQESQKVTLIFVSQVSFVLVFNLQISNFRLQIYIYLNKIIFIGICCCLLLWHSTTALLICGAVN